LHKNESVPFIKRTSLNAAKSQSKYPLNISNNGTSSTGNNSNNFQKSTNYLKPNNTAS